MGHHAHADRWGDGLVAAPPRARRAVLIARTTVVALVSALVLAASGVLLWSLATGSPGPAAVPGALGGLG